MASDLIFVCLTCKQMLTRYFRLHQAQPFQRYYVLCEVWDAHQKQASICVYKAYTFILFF